MIDLNEKYIIFIKNVFDKYLNIYDLYLFGSRALGNAKKYSDIDLAVDSRFFTDEIKVKIASEFENSDLPYEVDIVDINSITSEFYNLIKPSLVKL